MEITDIIGEGKAFEPPFHIRKSKLLNDVAMFDANQIMLCKGFKNEIIARHICDLLNQEHCEQHKDFEADCSYDEDYRYIYHKYLDK